MKLMALDQHGQAVHGLDPKRPRKALLDRLGAKKASKMYVDTFEREAVHVGYIVGSRWFTFYQVTEWEGK